MTISIVGTSHQRIVAYRKDMSNPAEGYVITIGSYAQVEITQEEADRLGRYLLFDDASDE